jgi:hypothetical protein
MLMAIGCGGGGSRARADKKVAPYQTSPKISQVVTADGIVGAQSQDEGVWLGRSVAVGDFNGDGYADIAAGMPGANGRRGAVALIYGSASGMDLQNRDLYTRARLTQDFFTGHQSGREGDQFGYSVAVGDFDHDGLDDVAIGAPFRSEDDHPETGKVFIAYGNNGRGPSAMTIRRSTFTQTGAGRNEARDHFGWSLAAADFDGDNFADLAIGTPDEDDANTGRADTGVVFIRYGSVQGLKSENYRFVNARRATNGGNEPEAGERFGTAVAGAHLHNDSNVHRADLVVGAPGKDYTSYSASARRDFTESDIGRIYLFAGASQTSAFVHTADIQPSGSPVGPTGFGSSLAIGDFNGNGRLDLAAGASQCIEGGAEGLVYVMYAYERTAYLGLADDARQPWVRRANRALDQVPIEVSERGDQFGYALVAADFNADNVTDLAVGSPGERWHGQSAAGLVFVFVGSSDGGLVPAYGSTFFLIDQEGAGSNEANDQFGFALAAGDVNGDRLPDLIIGAPYENRNGVADVGAVFLANTVAFTVGVFHGTWQGTISGDNGTSATLTLDLKDVDGFVSGSMELSEAIEFQRCRNYIPGYTPDPAEISGSSNVTTQKASRQATSATIALGDLVDPARVTLTANGTFTVAHDNVTMTGAVTVRDVCVNAEGVWVCPGSCSNIDRNVTLQKVQ